VAEELFGHRIEDLLAPAVENPVGSGLCGIGEIGEVGEGGLVGFAWLGDDEDMRRRAFLLTVTVLAEFGRGDPSAALAAVRQGLVELAGQGALDPLLAEQSLPEGALLGSGAAVRADLDADAWAELAFDYGERYPLTPAVRLFGPLAADFAYLQQALLHTADAAERRELNRAGALLAALLAQTMNSLAGPREAQRHARHTPAVCAIR
jgi:hypothetical protein